ncbi:MAG: SPOR domain-containing protein [Alphaproteobacteria bacterium]|nr:SPOR domain-containing protein [Alphaproteobacteria bacterium]
MQDQDMDTSQEDILASFREERLEQRRKKPAILIGVSIGIVIAVVVGWITFGKYVSVYYGADRAELPVIRADSSADGMKPATPGGMEVPNRDKLVYERLRQNKSELPVERLLPSAEKPLKPEPSEKEEPKQKDEIGALTANIIQEEQKQASALLYEEDGTPVEVVFKETPAAVEKAEKKELPPKEEEKQAEQKISYSVQLVSTRSESAAESEWKRLSKKFKEIIAEQPHFVSKTVVSSGTFYRLRVGSFEKREDAALLCEQLKTKKQECFVVK